LSICNAVGILVVQWVLIAVAGLWPAVAFLGGLGYSPLLLVAALLCLPAGGPKMKFRFYMFSLLAALEFITASIRWSPQPLSFAEVNLDSGQFAVHFGVLKVGFGLLWTAILMAAANTLTPRQARSVIGVATVAILVQLIVVAVLAVFEKQALAFFYKDPASWGEGVQNISRNGIIMALAAPFLIVGMGRSLSFQRALFVEIAVFVAVLAVLFTRGVLGGIVSVAAGLAAVAIVRLFPRHGFKILGAVLAFTIAATPLVFGAITRGADAVTATTSAEWRLAIWNRVIEVIRQDPFFGQGLGVLRTMREKIPSGVFQGELFVPNHAHNMVLQLWAETGAIGATLVAVTVLLAGFRMPQPRVLGVSGFLAAALGGQFMAIALVSFDLWNDWWWACAGLLAALIVVMRRANIIDDPARLLPAADASRPSNEPRITGFFGVARDDRRR
jgi:O-antigen ligase